MDQVVDIAEDGRHLSRYRGFLQVTENGSEVGKVPLDQIAAVIVHGHGTTWSTSLLVELANRGVAVVLCDKRHAPRGVLMPIEGHHTQGARMRAQWEATRPLMKRAWKQVVVSKVRMQEHVLSHAGQPSARLRYLAGKVTSGDTTNVEAQAARYYWPLLMGSGFRRELDGDGCNGLLNYGYTILRSAASRAVVAAGLHPTIGIHHSNRGNAFALSDDIMEPFRPLVDCCVRNIAQDRGLDVDTHAKKALARLIAIDLPFEDSTTPLSLALVRLATSLGRSLESGELKLSLPATPGRILLSSLGR